MGILADTKFALGVVDSDTSFDPALIMYINGVFPDLTQFGIGPELGFEITGDSEDWSDFYGSDIRYNSVANYLYLRVRMLFDPPATSYLINAFTAQIEKLEWRITHQVESLLPIPGEEVV